MATIRAILAVVLSCAPVLAQVRPSVSIDELQSLASSRSVKELNQRYARLPKTFPVRAVFAERSYHFKVKYSDRLVLMNLPNSGEEMEEFNSLIDARGAAAEGPLVRSWDNFYRAASRAVVRNPEFMRKYVLVMSQYHDTPVFNVEFSEGYCDLGVYVYRRRPKEYLRAVREESAIPGRLCKTESCCPLYGLEQDEKK